MNKRTIRNNTAINFIVIQSFGGGVHNRAVALAGAKLLQLRLDITVNYGARKTTHKKQCADVFSKPAQTVIRDSQAQKIPRL